MAKAKINWAEKFTEMQALQGIDPEGEGWFTAKEFREKMGVGQSKGYRLMSKAMDENKLEAFTGSIWSDTHEQCFRQVWYRFTDPKSP